MPGSLWAVPDEPASPDGLHMGRQQRVLRELLESLSEDNALMLAAKRVALRHLDAADLAEDPEIRSDHLREIRALLDALLHPTGE